MPIVLLGPGQADIQDDFPGMYGLVTTLWLDGCCHQSSQSTRAGNPLIFPRLYCINVFFYGRPVKPNSQNNWLTLPLVPVRLHFHALMKSQIQPEHSKYDSKHVHWNKVQ